MLSRPESPGDEAPDRQPLVGRFAHLVVVIGTIAGNGSLGWSVTDSAPRVLLSTIAVLASAGLWMGTGARADPERSPLARVTIAGPIRLGLELALIVAAGIGIWIAWNRAAGETFLTAAALDFAVRYQRIAALLRSH